MTPDPTTRRALGQAALPLASLCAIFAGTWLAFGPGCALIAVGALLWLDLALRRRPRK